MSEVLRSFDEPIRDESGAYHARVVGRYANDRMWEGWFEFVPIGGRSDDVLVSAVETRQPERTHLVYWASGLSPVYAEGALQRAKHPVTKRAPVVELPVSDAPAPRAVTLPPRVAGPEPVLDPFDVGARNLDILRQELGALNRPRLINIIAAYGLNVAGQDLEPLSDLQLIDLIVSSVESALLHRAR